MSAEAAVLDASALLAFLFDERGAEKVEGILPRAVMSTVNWSEVCQWVLERGAEPGLARERLLDAGLRVEPLSVADAEDAARLRPETQAAGLSLADRCCLALARRLRLPVLTADAAWMTVDVGADVQLVR